MHFMNCTGCQHLVEVNCTGICLGCQMGFAGPQKDSWTHHRDSHDDSTFDKQSGILAQTLEDKYAFKEREEPANDIKEHSDGIGSGETPSSSDRPKRRRQAKKETKTPEI